MRRLSYNDVSADRNTVAIVQALEALLASHVAGQPGGVVEVEGAAERLVLRLPGRAEGRGLYPG